MRERTYSHWVRLLEKARAEPNIWHTSDRYYSETTARQTACDIRHGRRIAGIKPGENIDADCWLIGDGTKTYEIAIRISTQVNR
jgi:hypothetical protein